MGIEERDGKFCVVDDGKVKKRCDTRAEAEEYMRGLAEDDKQFLMLAQTDVQYVTLSATPGQACANCRWFKTYGDQWLAQDQCHIVTNYPEAIEPTGHCQRWEATEVFKPEPMPVVIVEGAAELTPEASKAQAAQRTLMQRFRGLLGGSKQLQTTGLKVFKNHWLITWSNNFEDREDEIFTEKAIDDYVWRVDNGFVPLPELWVWHSGAKTRIGAAAWVGRHGHFLVAAGTFDETPQAQSAKAFYAKNAAKTGISHGYTFPAAAFDGKHYHEFNTFEISTLPRGAEANQFTSLEGVKAMALDETKRAYLEKVFGKEAAASILQQWDERGKALEEVGVAFKAYAKPDDEVAAKAVETIEADVKELILDVIADNAAAATNLEAAGKAYTAHDARIKALETQLAAMQELLDQRPRSASKDADTQISAADITETVANQFKRVDAFWGTEVNELPTE